MYKIFVLEFEEKKHLFERSAGIFHLHIFPKSEDKCVFMWFKQHLPWKAYPHICGDIFMSMTVQKRDGQEIGFSVIFKESQTLIDQKWKVILWCNWCHRKAELIILWFPNHYCFNPWRKKEKQAFACRILHNWRSSKRNLYQIILSVFQKVF